MRTQLIQLESGGQLAVDEYGDPQGRPVLFCHGWPSSRSMAVLADDAAKETGVRIISPDRPGIYQSSFQAGRRLQDWPPIVEQLARALDLARFRVLGISGGAPYAYASAYYLPERVEAVAVVSGAPPIAELEDRAGLFRWHRWMLALHARRPQLLRKLFYAARPFCCLRFPRQVRPLVLKLVHPADAGVLRDARFFDACFESSRRAWRASLEGVMADAEIYALPWEIPLEQIQTPVRLWHGTKDRTFSPALAEQVAKRLPNCQLKIFDGAGHFSLPIRRMPEILKDLLAAS